jgi:DNA-directed RNA polymerase specialized sigma24 family protein
MAGSITNWIQGLRDGEEEAAQKLWERYFHSLIELVRHKLPRHGGRLDEPEDVALSALDSFFRGVQRDRFPRLEDRSDLWRLLVVIAQRKTVDCHQLAQRIKRGGGAGHALEGLAMAVDELPAQGPTPELAVQMAEDLERLLGLLTEPELRHIALWKLEGFTVPEIAAKLGCVPRTVERKLRRIRALWGEEPDE